MELASVHQKGHHRGTSLDLRTSLGFTSTLHVRNFSAGSNETHEKPRIQPTIVTNPTNNGGVSFLETRIPGLGGPARVCKVAADEDFSAEKSPSQSTSRTTGPGHSKVPSTDSILLTTNPNQQQQHVRNLSLDSALQHQRQLQSQQHLPPFAVQLNGGHLLQVSGTFFPFFFCGGRFCHANENK